MIHKLIILLLVLSTITGLNGTIYASDGIVEASKPVNSLSIPDTEDGLSCLSVIFSPHAVICGTTTITAQVNCQFDGVVQLYAISNPPNVSFPTGDLVVNNGIFQFDVTVEENAPSYIDIITTVISTWSDPTNCVLDQVCEPSTLVTLCQVPDNNICDEAEEIDVSINHCDYESYSSNLWSASGIEGDCGASTDYDLFFKFEAISEELHVLFGEIPSNSMSFELFNSCDGEVIYCLSMGAYTNLNIDDLDSGNEYIIRLSDLPGDNEGLIEMCIWSPFFCDLSSTTEIVQDERCPGECNGIASVTPNAGTPPYVYSWSNNNINPTSYNLCPGTHYVEITDAFGCEVRDSVLVEAGTTVIAHAGEDINLCKGDSVQLQASGGDNYSWFPSDGLNDSLIADPMANPEESTTYFLTVTNEMGCIDYDTIQLAVHEKPEIQITGDSIACSGDSIKLELAELQPLNYLWNTGDSTSQTVVRESGIYSLVANDTFGCESMDSFLVNILPSIEAQYEISPESGFKFNNGSIQADIQGGMSPYHFTWNTGDTLDKIENLTPGMYSLALTDDFGCFFSDTVSIDTFFCPPITINSTFDTELCPGECNGFIQIDDLVGSSGPYGLIWNTGAETDSIGGLCPGSYSVLATDSLNCSISDSFLIEEATRIDIIVDDIRHFKPNLRGFIKIDLDGPYTVEWNGPNGFQAFTENIYGLGEGCYDLLVTDTLSYCMADTTICIENLTNTIFGSGATQSAISIYPNPARDQLRIEWNQETGYETIIELYTLEGKRMYSVIKSSDQEKMILPLDQLQQGMYLLKLQSGQNTYSKRIFVME